MLMNMRFKRKVLDRRRKFRLIACCDVVIVPVKNSNNGPALCQLYLMNRYWDQLDHLEHTGVHCSSSTRAEHFTFFLRSFFLNTLRAH